MTVAESASIGEVLSRVYRLLKKHTGAERIYQLSIMEGQPHFHAWLVPRRKGISERGLKLLARDDTCSLADVVALAGRLRYEMAVGQSA
jgi:diadenosine tetraphosphate (Ap4A) HIT family hydrolase